MNRVRIVLVVVTSLLLGGVVFKVGSGQAQPGQHDPWSQPPPAPPAPPHGPLPPTPPKAPKAPKAPKLPKVGGGLSISIRGGKVHIEGLDQLVAGHLDSVRHMLANNPNIPKDVRDKIVARMDRVKAIVDRHVKNLDTSDLDKLDDQLEKLGDDLEKAMEGLDADLAKLGDKLGKDLAKSLGKDVLRDLAKQKLAFGPDPADPSDDSDDDDDNHASHDTDDHGTDDDDLPNADADDADLRAAVDHLKNFALKPGQKDAIAKLRATADAKVANERRALDEASKQLETALASAKTSDDDISRAVDRITAHEAAIRKARLLSWVQARRVLDADQIKQLEDAAGKTR